MDKRYEPNLKRPLGENKLYLEKELSAIDQISSSSRNCVSENKQSKINDKIFDLTSN